MQINNKYLREEYISRINRVIDYIEKNIAEELTLKKLADVANFSEFHFHRLFSAIVGESLNKFITRIKVEKAALLLLMNPKQTIMDICFEAGFSNPSTFSRVFRDNFNLSPSEWRDLKLNSKNEQEVRKNEQVFSNHYQYLQKESSCFCNVISDNLNNLIWRIEMDEKLKTTIEVKELPEMHLAYIRHIGPYKGNPELFQSLFGKLFKWAGPRGLFKFPDFKTLCVYHDNPDITDDDKLRLSCCITVPPNTPVDGEIGSMVIPKGNYAVAHFEILSHQYGEAWNIVCGEWLPQSGYQPDDRLAFEINLNDPSKHPERIHIVDICVPVKPL